MKDQIIVSKHNGEVAIAVPLFRWHHSQEIAKIEGYSVSLTSSKPLAYVLDIGTDNCTIVRAEIIENQCEFIGDL